MKRTIFCVALILCMAIMAGCAAQASGKTQTPISAKTELTSAQKADDTAEVVTALLPSQTVEENSKTEDSADTPLPVERASRIEISMPCGTPTPHAASSRMWMSRASARCWATATCGSRCKPMSMSPCGISSRRCRASASCPSAETQTLRRQKSRQAKKKPPCGKAQRCRFPK